MLFNSHEFLLLFLPGVWIGFVLLARLRRTSLLRYWLIAGSFAFYAHWDLRFVPLLVLSILMNYAAGAALRALDSRSSRLSLWILVAAVAANLGLLGYFKYANFFVDSLNLAFGSSFVLEKIILPLAISFFTFQQIAYVIDCRRDRLPQASFSTYVLFVVFFPQLIAGPIVRFQEMAPQYERPDFGRVPGRLLASGLMLLLIGLAKKVLLADTFAQYATPVFFAADRGIELTMLEGWIGALMFTFQLYFDFSGYSDMAVGLGALFGIGLAINFNAPYKALDIAEFWRRWHMTLSRFLRDYLYIPLGGNRRGRVRSYVNLMVTMLLGGLWHGAAWTFVVWGGLHGLFLAAHRLWSGSGRRRAPEAIGATGQAWRWAVTFICVVAAWTFFRAESFAGAWSMIAAMTGQTTLSLPTSLAGFAPAVPVALHPWLSFDGMFPNMFDRFRPGFPGDHGLLLLPAALLATLALPASQQLVARVEAAIDGRRNLAIPLGAIGGGCLVGVILFLTRKTEFLYFNF